MGEDEGLTPEQQVELDEAVKAQQDFEALPKLFEAMVGPGGTVQILHRQIIELLGTESMGAPAYCRNQAITKLEELVHRIHDGMSAMHHREQAELEAMTKAQAKGNIIQFGRKP